MIKYSKKLFLFLILFFYIYILLGNYAIFAYSKSSIEDLSIEELMNVSISSNIVRADKILPASVTLLTGEQLIMSGARTLNEALSLLVPGYCMIEDQDDVISGFRGLAPDNNAKVMLLINGQNMNTEFFWGPPDCILNSIDFDWIENIEIIRGPGSVTLGQGALLGAINIITKKNNDNESSGSASLRAGSNNYYGINLEYTGSKYYVYIAKTKFSGFKMENSGWGSRNFEGAAQGLLYNAGHKVKRSDNHTIFSRIASKNFSIDIIDIEQTRDLYNFYRDRDIFDERLQSITANFKTEFSSKLKLTTTASFTRDDFFLNSVNGIKTGGTREERFGIKSLLNANEIPSGNDLAIGVEARLYSMGKNNSEEANYIINRIDTETLSELQTANNTRTFAYKDSIRVFSFFAENFYKISPSISFFGAFRCDNHPNWNNNISPRAGFLYNSDNNLKMRLSYQEGFRGAVGVHYSGGYRNDGFLSEKNFNKIESATNGRHSNIDSVRPEKIKSIEFDCDYRFSEYLECSLVSFYSIVKDVIDVGVLWAESDTGFHYAGQYNYPMIGTDMPGDWNGYWYYKNNQGKIKNAGIEFSVLYKKGNFNSIFSHSFAHIMSSSAEQRNGSMYISQNNEFKAYPSQMTKFNISYYKNHFSGNITSAYYYHWYSPVGNKVKGNFIANASAKYAFFENLNFIFSIKNILNQKNLYQMNNNAGDSSLSDGTPTVERQNFSLGIEYFF